MTRLVASAAASLARKVPVAMMAWNSLVISSCTRLRTSPSRSLISLGSVSDAGLTAGGTGLAELAEVALELGLLLGDGLILYLGEVLGGMAGEGTN